MLAERFRKGKAISRGPEGQTPDRRIRLMARRPHN